MRVRETDRLDHLRERQLLLLAAVRRTTTLADWRFRSSPSRPSSPSYCCCSGASWAWSASTSGPCRGRRAARAARRPEPDLLLLLVDGADRPPSRSAGSPAATRAAPGSRSRTSSQLLLRRPTAIGCPPSRTSLSVPISSAPLGALDHRHVGRILSGADLALVHPLEVGAVQVAVGDLELDAVLARGSPGLGSRSTIWPVRTAPSASVTRSDVRGQKNPRPFTRIRPMSPATSSSESVSAPPVSQMNGSPLAPESR